MKLFGGLSELIGIVFRKNNVDVQLRPNQTTTYSANTDIQLPQDTAQEQELVGKNSTQTLINKTISGVSNTLQNIQNSSTTATSSNTANAIVARGADGSFFAGPIVSTGFSGNLVGNVSGTLTGNVIGNVSGTSSNITGIAAIVNGGTGQTTASGAINALLPAQSGQAGKYLTTDGSVSSWGTVAAGSSTSKVTKTITQAGHGFSVGNVLRAREPIVGTYIYQLAATTTEETAQVVGIVSQVIDVNTFELTLSGEITGLSSLLTGYAYYLNSAVAGTLSTTSPNGLTTDYRVKVGIAINPTTLFVLPQNPQIPTGATVSAAGFQSNVTHTSGTSGTISFGLGSFSLTAGLWLVEVKGLSLLSLASYPIASNQNVNLNLYLRNTTTGALTSAASSVNNITRNFSGEYTSLNGQGSYSIVAIVYVASTSSFAIQSNFSSSFNANTNNITHLISYGATAVRLV